MDGVEQIMGKRINQFGVAQPNIQKDAVNNRLYIELPGVQDEATVAEKLQSTANLQFFETYQKEDIQMLLSQANQLSLQAEVVIKEIDTTVVNDTNTVAKVDSAAKPTNSFDFNASKKGLDAYHDFKGVFYSEFSNT